MRAVRPLVALICLLGLTAMEAHASGDTAQSRFAKRKLTYADRSVYSPAVEQAVSLWNAAGTGVRLRPVRKGRRAQIVVSSKDRLLYRGEEVAGLGGGKDRRGRRRSGRVRLSTSALGDGAVATPEQINVAAHELGHALGLGHSMAACDLMNPFGDPEARGCSSPAGFYRCGPQAADASALARLYRRKANFPGAGGLCPTPTDPVEILGPPAEVALGPWEAARFEVRNAGARVWGAYDMSATYTDPAGNPAPSPCFGERMTMSMVEPEVVPGAIATFEIPTCGESGTRTTYHVRLVDERDPGRPLPFGPVHTFTVNVA